MGKLSASCKPTGEPTDTLVVTNLAASFPLSDEKESKSKLRRPS